jgi:hypothetical protein
MYSFVTLVMCYQWHNAAVKTFKKLYACLMHIGYVLLRGAMGDTLGTKQLFQHLLAWPMQTAPSSVTNQYRDEMK